MLGGRLALLSLACRPPNSLSRMKTELVLRLHFYGTTVSVRETVTPPEKTVIATGVFAPTRTVRISKVTSVWPVVTIKSLGTKAVDGSALLTNTSVPRPLEGLANTTVALAMDPPFGVAGANRRSEMPALSYTVTVPRPQDAASHDFDPHHGAS